MKKNYGLIPTYREEETPAETPGNAGGDVSPEPQTPQEETPPADTGEDTVAEEANDLWNELFDDSEEEETPEPQPDSQEEETPPEPQEEETPPVPAEETPTPDATPAEETPPETPTPEEHPIPEPQQPTEEQIRAHQKQIQEALEKRYQLSEDDALRLATDPAKVWPTMAAKLFQDVYQQVTQSIQRGIPQAVEQTMQVNKVRSEKVDNFFKAWPKLDRKVHGADIARLSTVYSQSFPNASDEQVIQDVGVQVMFLHKISPEAETPSAPETPQIPPRTPLSVNGATPPQSRALNEFEQMADEFLEDDAL